MIHVDKNFMPSTVIAPLRSSDLDSEDYFHVLTSIGAVPPSPAATCRNPRRTFRIAAVQLAWNSDATEMKRRIAEGVRIAATHGAKLVCLQELTLSPYFAVRADDVDNALKNAEHIPNGPTTQLAISLAREHQIYIHASLYERADDGEGGYNTAICVNQNGDVVARTRKV